MNDNDIYAFNPPPVRPTAAPSAAPSAGPSARRRPAWPWLLGAAALLLLVLAASLSWALVSLLEHAGDGVQVVANGEPWGPDNVGVLGTALVALLGVGGALLVAGLAAMLVVFLVVPLVLLAVLLAVGLGLGGAVLAAAAVAAVVLSPLWLFVLLLWLLLRRRPQAVPARMGA